MKVKNAQELAVLLDINFSHLQTVWKSFVQTEGYSESIAFTCLNELLTQDEKYYLMYLGLNSISDAVMNSLKDKPGA